MLKQFSRRCPSRLVMHLDPAGVPCKGQGLVAFLQSLQVGLQIADDVATKQAILEVVGESINLVVCLSSSILLMSQPSGPR